ncbi:hypothetical protein [Hwanghaeella grinnelliae]|uniref:hypothetical protein n=1 Tax=Hwanghaeella grinnelliae TaxID=2500179 RepID=UPI0018770085|nr:hypothetical protein [Hwanghaeella grinnelliae]
MNAAETAQFLIAAAQLWLGAGAVIAIAFLLFGLDRVEPNARGGYVFRVLIAPGLVLLWPIVLWRWRLAASGREAWRNRHTPQRKAIGRLGFGLAACIAAILLTALMVRPDGSTPPPPEKLSLADIRGWS